MGMKRILLLCIILISLKQVQPQAVVCSCDLTSNACNANCCCDTDCTPEDVAVFACSNTTVNEDSKLCVNNLVFVNNIPSTSVVEDNGVFCIIKDSDTSRNFYNEPTLLNTTAEFDAAVAQYPTYSYDFTLTTPTSAQVYYVAGDTIDVVYANGLRGKLVIPASGVASTCLDGNPASFMSDQSISCARRFNITQACANGTYLDPQVYYSPDVFQISAKPILTNSTIDLVNITICNINESAPLLSLNGGSCLNAVQAVSYIIAYNGTTGISSACATITQGTISGSSVFQTVSISYIAINTIINNTEERSGNPGYLVGKPLRTALGSSTSSVNRTLTTDQLTVLLSEDGNCGNAAQQQIKFGQDQRTGCLLSFSSTTICNETLTNVKTLLNVGELSLVSVATFGNISVESAGDWVDVKLRGSSDIPPTTEFEAGAAVGVNGDGCKGMLVGINYYVFFANFGSISNPQAKIVGIQYAPVLRDLQYECYLSDCAAGTTLQYTEITSSVTFTDTSSTPVTILKERPTVNAILPDDFFFPFTSL